MHYQIYLDSLLIQEMIVNFYVLELCKLCLMSTATHIRLLFAAFFAGFFQVILLCISFPKNIVLFYIIVFILYATSSFFTVEIAFGKEKLPVSIKRATMYMAFMLVIGGIFMGVLPRFPFYNASKIKIIVFMVAGAMVYVLLWQLLKKRRMSSYYGSFRMCHKEASVEGKYFMDSGNGLVESISKKPVLIADTTWFFESFQKEDMMCRPVIYKSVGKQKGILYAYCVDELVIYGDVKAYTYEKVWIGVCREELFKNRDYQVILPLFYGTHYE